MHIPPHGRLEGCVCGLGSSGGQLSDICESRVVIDNINNLVCNTISNRILERDLVVSSIEPKTADVMFPRSNIAIHGGIFNNQNFPTNRTFKGV